MWGFIWNSGIVNPMTNLLLFLYDLLGNNFFLALIAFTALIRLITLPLSLKQQQSMMKSQELQPQIQAIQKKYKDDPSKMQEEFNKLGYNPMESVLGCFPLLIQMPVFFGLYQAILFVLSSTPQGLYQLSERAYQNIDLTELLPVSNSFFWLNLAQPDPYLVLPILVAGTMYLQQRLSTPTPTTTSTSKSQAEDSAASIQKQMLVTMPVMFGFLSLSFASGLSIYFIVSNLIGIVQSYIMQRSRNQLQAAKTGNIDVLPTRAIQTKAKDSSPSIDKRISTGKTSEKISKRKRRSSKE